MRILKPTLLVFGCLFALSCSSAPEDGFDVQLRAPSPRSARVQLTAALDMTGLGNEAFTKRIVIDEITVNVAALRLLGENPAIPLSGQPLIQEDFVLSSAPTAAPGLFPFPAAMLDTHLAVYARIDQSPLLNHASVVVKARLLEGAANGFQQNLTSGGTNGGQTSPNPDGEPNREEAPNPDGEPNREESPNPDGEPNQEESPNPDGEPNREDEEEDDDTGHGQQGLRMSAAPAGVAPISVPFILRGHDQVEMVVSFDADSQMNVTLGIPATRWITPEVIKQMEAALIEKRAGPQPTSNRKQKTEKTLVLDSSNQESGLSGQGNEDCVSEYLEDYRLIDDDAKDPKHLRSH